MVEYALLRGPKAAFRAWSETPAEERVSLLLELSRVIQRRRLEMAAWMAFEVGKSWPKRCRRREAIDFCEFYAREALRLAGPQELVEYPARRIPVLTSHGVALVVPVELPAGNSSRG